MVDLVSAACQFLSADPGTAQPVVITLDSGESSQIPDRADEIPAALTIRVGAHHSVTVAPGGPSALSVT